MGLVFGLTLQSARAIRIPARHCRLSVHTAAPRSQQALAVVYPHIDPRALGQFPAFHYWERAMTSISIHAIWWVAARVTLDAYSLALELLGWRKGNVQFSCCCPVVFPSGRTVSVLPEVARSFILAVLLGEWWWCNMIFISLINEVEGFV